MTGVEKRISLMRKHWSIALQTYQDHREKCLIPDSMEYYAIVSMLTQAAELAINNDREIPKLYPELPWNAIIGMRNRMVHDYESISPEVIKSALENNIPKMVTWCDKVLTLLGRV